MNLRLGGSRLCELACNTPDLHYRACRGIGEHHSHLENHPERGFDRLLAELIEALGAIPALQQEGLPAGDGGKPCAQLRDLAGEDQ